MIGEVDRHGAERVPDVAERRRAGRLARVGRRKAVRRTSPATPAIVPTRRAAGRCSKGLFGKTVTLQSGETVIADEAYVRESILNPAAKVAAGFQPIMPTFQGLVTEEQLLRADRVRQVAAERLPQAQTKVTMPQHRSSCRRGTT